MVDALVDDHGLSERRACWISGLSRSVRRRDKRWNHKRVHRVYREMGLNIPARRVIRVLVRIAAWRGYPQKLRMDNGPEFIAAALADWAEEQGVPDVYVFRTLSEVRERADVWLRTYNEEFPHKSLGMLTPVEYRLKSAPETSGNGWH